MNAWRVDWNVSPYVTDSLRWFTVIWLFELFLGFWLLARQVRRGGGDDSEAADLAVHVWIGLVIGARLGEAFFYQPQRLLADPAWVFRIASGGLSSHGAVLGTGFAAWLFAKRRSLAFLEVTDRLAPSFAVAAIVHRIANLFNSEIVGKPTDGSWGMRFPLYDHNSFGPFRHPSQLYEAALGVVVLYSVWLTDRLWGREERPRGILTGIALSTYFAGRCIVELAKEAQSDEMLAGPLNMGQLLSLPLLAAGLFLAWRSLRSRAKAGWSVVALLTLLAACEPRPPLPQSAAAAPTTAAPQPSASALAPSSLPATKPPPRSNCGLATPEHIELMPVFHQRVVVQKQSLGPVKLRGAPRLIAEPEDFAEYYLGESAIDPKTLPAPLQALRGAQLHVLRGSDECKPKLGAFSAFAWADEEGAGWSRTSPAANAARVFRKGERFLVAQLEPNCELFGGLVTLSAIDGYRRWDKVIDEPDSVGGPTRRALFQQALATLPEGGANLPRTDLHWTQATLADASLLVLELQTGSPQPTFLRVWCVETDGSLVPLGPGPTPPEHSDAITHYRHHIDFIGREGSLPIILYSYFGLEPSTGRYTYFNPAIGPAPHI